MIGTGQFESTSRHTHYRNMLRYQRYCNGCMHQAAHRGASTRVTMPVAQASSSS